MITLSFTAMELTDSSENRAQNLWQTAISQFNAGNPKSCFERLDTLKPALIGDISFDRMLGICAQGAGQNDQALLAFNRILAQQPNNAEIRLERARVYYSLNLYAPAEQEFYWLRSNQPPKAALIIIDRYLSAIDNKKQRVKKYTLLQISTSLGYDDNVNAASELDEFLGFALSDSSKAQSSGYAAVSLNAEHMHVLSNRSGLKISTSLSSKRYPSAGFVDQDLATVGVGYTKHFKQKSIGAELLAFRQNVDGSLNAKGTLGRVYYHQQLSQNFSLMPYIKASALRYSDSLLSKNVNQYAIGTAFKYRLDSNDKRSIGFDLSLAHDNPIYADSNYEQDLSTLKVNYQHKFTDKLSNNTQLQYTLYDYDNAFFSQAFPEPRSDNQWLISNRTDWMLGDNLKVSPKVGYADFSSNIGIFSYERWYAEINITYKWLW